MSVLVDVSQVTRLAADFARKAVTVAFASRETLARVAREVEDEARRDAPVDTGALQGSVYLRLEDDEAVIGSPLKQGFYQEFGTSRHPPQPWLFPAGERGATKLGMGLELISDPFDL